MNPIASAAMRINHVVGTDCASPPTTCSPTATMRPPTAATRMLSSRNPNTLLRRSSRRMRAPPQRIPARAGVRPAVISNVLVDTEVFAFCFVTKEPPDVIRTARLASRACTGGRGACSDRTGPSASSAAGPARRTPTTSGKEALASVGTSSAFANQRPVLARGLVDERFPGNQPSAGRRGRAHRRGRSGLPAPLADDRRRPGDRPGPGPAFPAGRASPRSRQRSRYAREGRLSARPRRLRCHRSRDVPEIRAFRGCRRQLRDASAAKDAGLGWSACRVVPCCVSTPKGVTLAA